VLKEERRGDRPPP